MPQPPPALLRDLATSCLSAGGIGRLVLACQSICSSIGPCVSSPFGMARDCRSRALIASFDGIIDGGTSGFAAAHGTFHATTLPNGDMQITAVINQGQQ